MSASLADTVVGFLDALGISRAHLVGHSLGGAVVAAVARSTPGRVASLTLLAPAGYSVDADAEYLRGFAAAATRRELKPLVGRLFADPALVTRQLVDDLLRFKRLDGVDKALSALLGTLLDGDRQAIDTRGLLEGVDVPVTVVWGARRTGSCLRPRASANGWMPGTWCTWRRRTTSSACCGHTCSRRLLTNGALVGRTPDESAARRIRTPWRW